MYKAQALGIICIKGHRNRTALGWELCITSEFGYKTCKVECCLFPLALVSLQGQKITEKNARYRTHRGYLNNTLKLMNYEESRHSSDAWLKPLFPNVHSMYS